ncbi:MAG: DUF3417 domain-containing protein, partial [Phycisphaerales bacterium]|nr:DUF3417 domain-containing protein [Phycisphaerales bacterium]
MPSVTPTAVPDPTIAKAAAALPEKLRPLARLAYDLCWSWTDPLWNLFAAIDPGAWSRTHHNPVATLLETPRLRLDELARDPAFLRRVADAESEQARLAASPGRCAPRTPGAR